MQLPAYRGEILGKNKWFTLYMLESKPRQYLIQAQVLSRQAVHLGTEQGGETYVGFANNIYGPVGYLEPLCRRYL
jgi:hypothetical protein